MPVEKGRVTLIVSAITVTATKVVCIKDFIITWCNECRRATCARFSSTSCCSSPCPFSLSLLLSLASSGYTHAHAQTIHASFQRLSTANAHSHGNSLTHTHTHTHSHTQSLNSNTRTSHEQQQQMQLMWAMSPSRLFMRGCALQLHSSTVVLAAVQQQYW